MCVLWPAETMQRTADIWYSGRMQMAGQAMPWGPFASGCPTPDYGCGYRRSSLVVAADRPIANEPPGCGKRNCPGRQTAGHNTGRENHIAP